MLLLVRSDGIRRLSEARGGRGVPPIPMQTPSSSPSPTPNVRSSDDIVKQMPEEGEKFRTVDAMWRAMMRSTHAAPAAIAIAREKERVDKLVECNALLDAIQKGLAAYLEKKRLFFPR